MTPLLFAVAVLAQPLPSVVTETRAAATDLQSRVAPIDRPHTRYVTAYSIPPAKRLEHSKVLRFWLNSLSLRRRITRPTSVSDTLYRIDLRDYGWDHEAWEKLTATDPYFRAEWLDRESENVLRTLSTSSGAIVRSDWFVVATSTEPHYSRMLGLPDTLAALKEKFGVQEKAIKSLSLQAGGAVTESIVALHNRQLERWPTITGYFWQSRDVNAQRRDAQDVLAGGDSLLTGIKLDGAEFIWSLPNGLQAYYLANSEGKQVPVVPPDIAQDSHTTLRDKQVRAARNCVGCHAAGINQFDDVVSSLIKGGVIDVRSYSKERISTLEDFYLSQLDRQIKRDQQAYADAVAAACGVEPEANAAAFEQTIKRYADDRVGLAEAAIDLGVTTDVLRGALARSYRGTLLVLVAGRTMAREQWEQRFGEAVELAGVGVGH